jgi:hypothetical protein
VTALTVPARAEHGARPVPVPWRRMAWVTWRQHRNALATVAVLVGASAVFLWIAGRQLRGAYAAVAACHPAGSVACTHLVNAFNGTNDFLANGAITQTVPALIGVFFGAPLLASELETGTFRFAWTQGFGRWRWALAKLTLLAVALTAATGALSVLISWYYQPYLPAGNPALGVTEINPFSPSVFDLRGVPFAAWTLAAIAIGALAGLVTRRVVPAMAVTLAAYGGLAFTAATQLRQHYLTPLVTSDINLPGSAWVISQFTTKDGKFAFTGFAPDTLLNRYCPAVRHPKASPQALSQCLSQHGYTQWTGYQPASRLLALQLIEAGWLLALSALLIAATVWLVRRRAV